MTYTTIVNNSTGLHARPAKVFVQLAKQFSSQIKVKANGKEADARSIISIIALGVKAGTEINIHINGEDEAEAYAAIKELFDNNLNEVE